MKHPKINIFKSVDGKIVHYLYKFRNEAIDEPVEFYINNLTPIAKIPEVGEVNREMKNIPVIREETPTEEPGFIKVSLPFEFLYKDSEFIISLKNSATADAHIKIRVRVGHSGNVIVREESEEYKYDIKASDYHNAFYISEKFRSYTITLDVTAKIIEYIDRTANGLYDPKFSCIDSTSELVFHQDEVTRMNTYMYKIIPINSDSKIGIMSKPVFVEIAEDAAEVFTTMFSSSDYTGDDNKATWEKLKVDYNLKHFKVSKENNNIASEIINVIRPHEIHADDELLISDGIRNLKVLNVWNRANRGRFLRTKKTFKFENHLNAETITNPQIITFDDKQEVFIDKIIVLKKDVTLLPDKEKKIPIEIDDAKAETLKVYLRQGGVYFEDFYLNDLGVNDDNDNEKVSVIALDSRFPLLSIKDSCLYSKKYNYTVYLYDETRKASKPVVAVL